MQEVPCAFQWAKIRYWTLPYGRLGGVVAISRVQRVHLYSVVAMLAGCLEGHTSKQMVH